MAKVFYGPNVIGMSGTIGNVVYSNWRGKGYCRSRALTVDNPQTVDQNRQRECVSEASKEWYRTLTAEMRALWNEHAGQRGSEYTQLHQSKGGQGIIPAAGTNMTGYNDFISVQLERESIGYNHRDEKVLNAPKGIDPPDSPSTLSVTYNSAENCIEGSVYAPMAPGAPHSYGNDYGETIEQPTMVRIWANPPGAPPRIAEVIPITGPGDLLFFNITDLKILGEEVPLYPGAYDIQADAVSGKGLRSGPSNLVKVISPLCCTFPDVPIYDCEFDVPTGAHKIRVLKVLVDDVCHADFIKVILCSSTAPGVLPQEFKVLREDWQTSPPSYYALAIGIGEAPVPGDYVWRIRPGNYCGSVSQLSDTCTTTVPA